MSGILISLLFFVAVCSQLQGCGSDKSPVVTETVNVLFDDFSYNDTAAFTANGWKVRTETGHPGIVGAKWSSAGLSFHGDDKQPDNRIVRMTSFTDGTGENTQHTQFCHARKFYEGTYAARIYFRDKPISGPDGDVVIETFYAISPLKAPMDLDYSEMDFEYLPNGGWGEGTAANFWATTWETFQLEPWTKDNTYSFIKSSYQGWRTLVLQAGEGTVRYFIDGEMLAEHSGHVYPEQPMSINFNLWFMPDGLISSEQTRVYTEDVDWVFFKAGVALDAERVEQIVTSFRQQGISFRDTVPAWTPKLPSLCGL